MSPKDASFSTATWLGIVGFLLVGVASATVFAFTTFETRVDHAADYATIKESLDRIEGRLGTTPHGH